MTILAYVLALPVVLGVATVAYTLCVVLATPLIVLTRKYRMIAAFMDFVLLLSSTALGAIAFVRLCKFFEVQPVFLMFLLPIVAFFLNDRARIKQAKDDTSRVARWLAAEGTEYDEKFNASWEASSMLANNIALCGMPILLGVPFS